MGSEGSPMAAGDEVECKKVAQMRALVEDQDPSAKEEDNPMLKRFLRARNQDIEKASAFFLKYLKWRRETVPNGFISESEIHNELAQKKAFIQGYDKIGRPIGVFIGSKHYKNDLNENKRFCVYLIDSLCLRMQGGQEKFTIIADLEGWGYKNCDIRGYLAGLDILQSNYPERLGKVFLVHAPSIFMKAWKIIYPFIDDNSKKKFIFVDDTKLKTTLLEDIAEDQLPEKYGGKLKLVPIEEAGN
ncbi:SEC14-like protein 2 [Dioscorea cayenensis subsp. rotundata]|uniref:SEC14-like protein 2 n=1 Tax=Dioscorea cayennensis subsp. rotundata TaxID=55577 RepID=A0AB40C033_DIOCR|nr:SEC14-like protein 2 [Dioscorea cayenensis subsp. rotundata]